MQTRPELERQMMRCGRLPPIAPDLLVRADRDRPIGFKDRHGMTRPFRTMPKLDAATCAGYACELPEVREVLYAYPQWKERTLTEWLGGPPSPVLLACLAAFEGGKNQCEMDRIKRQQQEAEDRRRHGQ